MTTRHSAPNQLTPDERTRRVAALLATGLLRLREHPRAAEFSLTSRHAEVTGIHPERACYCP